MYTAKIESLMEISGEMQVLHISEKVVGCRASSQKWFDIKVL